jgi:hypothetical protein
MQIMLKATTHLCFQNSITSKRHHKYIKISFAATLDLPTNAPVNLEGLKFTGNRKMMLTIL